MKTRMLKILVKSLDIEIVLEIIIDIVMEKLSSKLKDNLSESDQTLRLILVPFARAIRDRYPKDFGV